jgi:hypothetical protein
MITCLMSMLGVFCVMLVWRSWGWGLHDDVVCWLWCHSPWEGWMTHSVWTDSASGMPSCNCYTVPICSNASSLWIIAGVSCTQPWDHLWLAVFVSSTLNRFHLNNHNIFGIKEQGSRNATSWLTYPWCSRVCYINIITGSTFNINIR